MEGFVINIQYFFEELYQLTIYSLYFTLILITISLKLMFKVVIINIIANIQVTTVTIIKLFFMVYYIIISIIIEEETVTIIAM